jgi:hypothetical protein
MTKAPRRIKKAEGVVWIGKAATVEERIEFCALAAEEAFAEVSRQRDSDETDAGVAAQAAWKGSMPHITDADSVAAYIGCVAAGMQRGFINGAEAKAMLYTAQCAIMAHGRPAVRRQINGVVRREVTE